MAEIREGRARRLWSVGSLSGAIGGSYLWQLVRRPFRSEDDARESLLAAHVRNAERLIAGSSELRGAFTKLVQMLSMRSDLLPAEAIDVLAAARSAVPAMPFERVRGVLEAELHADVETLFTRLDPEAVAAASLGQVHRGVLPDGTDVAVKVQYPGVATSVGQDIQNAKALLRVLARVGREITRRPIDVDEVARELEERLLEELDYHREADNAEAFRTLLADDPEIVVPRVIRSHSAACVLTMTWVEGYPLEHVMAPGMDRRIQDWCAEKLFRLFYRQVLEFGVVQTDPHPGNYRVTHHPKLVMLDFGSVRRLDPEIRRGYVALGRALVDDDIAGIGAAGRQLGFVADDPSTFVDVMRLAAEPLRVDAPTDARDYDVVERATRALEIELDGAPVLAPGHHVFISRALLGLDGYLRAFGTRRNWHRILRELLDAPARDGRDSV
jgi:predicted unusual protein kinase regulating ubiquinone biosynthesis (AarF/ABC1/UbiB family)